MQKNIILIVAGAGDFFFGSDSNKVIKNKESLLSTLNTIVDNLKGRISGIKAQITIVGTACATLGGLFGFFIAQIVDK